MNGGALTLTWKDTFLGGAPGTAKHLDVTGAVTATVPISAGETITVPGVPPGTYAIAVRGANAAGSSAPSPPVSVTLPAGCTGVPLPPHRFLAYRDGNAVGLLWEPPPTGPAPATYELVVERRLHRRGADGDAAALEQRPCRRAPIRLRSAPPTRAAPAPPPPRRWSSCPSHPQTPSPLR